MKKTMMKASLWLMVEQEHASVQSAMLSARCTAPPAGGSRTHSYTGTTAAVQFNVLMEL